MFRNAREFQVASLVQTELTRRLYVKRLNDFNAGVPLPDARYNAGACWALCLAWLRECLTEPATGPPDRIAKLSDLDYFDRIMALYQQYLLSTVTVQCLVAPPSPLASKGVFSSQEFRGDLYGVYDKTKRAGVFLGLVHVTDGFWPDLGG